ncbi:PepSY domain-containing protein [Kurthia sibirica]|nr:PepSY domain-containing protein [Kurthia sibirica]GEK32829.1 hypothetical protein KSI01_03620 [Kurthia sibirica]
MLKNKMMHAILITSGVVLMICIYYLWSHFTGDTKPTTAKVFARIESIYGGEITDFATVGHTYEIVLHKQNEQYNLTINAATGDVESLAYLEKTIDKKNIKTKKHMSKKIKKLYPNSEFKVHLTEQAGAVVYRATISQDNGEVEIILNARTGEVISENQAVKHTALISTKEALRIAAEQEAGKVEATEFIKTTSGGYYLITLSEGQTKIVLQIHGTSGELISKTIKE